MLRRLAVLATLLVVVLVAHSASWKPATSDCLGLAPGAPNVAWFIKDSVAACPAADTLTNSARPSRLRITLYYEDLNCNPKVGVPPESIYVTTQLAAGNLKVNDEGAQVYADDSTDADGFARVTIPSFSGCGKVRLRLFVSGGSYGTKTATVRTTDVNADGRVSASEILAPCDLNYDGASNFSDVQLALYHENHWHRNALFGTPVRRTNYCGYPPCQGDPGVLGFSQIFWSPSGRWLTITARRPDLVPPVDCKVYVVGSDPKDGNAIRQITFSSPDDSADYDPSWSPLGQEITFGRKDNTIYRKGIPGFSTDNNTYLVTFHDAGGFEHRGDLNGAISPDGQWVAFSRRTVDQGPFEIFKIPINGDATKLTQLTSHATATDYYPQWSPDGQYIIFQRATGDTGYSLFRVRADTPGSDQPFYDHSLGKPYGYQATTPAYSPDGRIVLAGVGPGGTLDSVLTHTIDTTLTVKKPIKNYADTTFAVDGQFPILSPRLSPDGTRLALNANQVWAVRRNMSLPPQITQVGTQGVVDSTARVPIIAIRGLQTTVKVLASDPEGDPITCRADFLQDGMIFDPDSCKLIWTPTVPVGSTLYVKFSVSTNTWPKESGGTDAIIAVFTVAAPQPQMAQRAVIPPQPEGPNPTRGRFALNSPQVRGASATLTLFDVSGRRVAVVRGPSGASLVWDGRDQSGSLALPGIYLYRLEAGRYRREGKVVVFR